MKKPWQKIDDTYSVCAKCTLGRHNSELTKGVCDDCTTELIQRQERLVRMAENKVLAKGTKAAAQLLANIQSKGKSGASMPRVMDSFFTSLGGEEKFAELMKAEFSKAIGIGCTAEDELEFEVDPKLRLHWFDLIARHAAKTDEGKTLDVGSLEDSDLESILADLGRKQLTEDPALRRSVLLFAIQNDAEFRKLAFDEAIKEDPRLVDKLLQDHGILTVEGRVEGKTEVGNNMVEEDYDPMKDEYDG